MYQDRIPLYNELQEKRSSSLLVYITGDRRNLETFISSEALDYFIHHLDTIRNTQRISLFLYTRGGDTLSSWSIVNLIRQFCKELEVIVPFKAHSGGTLICLGADKIIMTKQATLSPIDPSISNALNPQIPGAAATAKVPVSVEDISAFLEFCSTYADTSNVSDAILLDLARQVHPLVLGKAFRAREQIRMLATRLLGRQIEDEGHLTALLNFLCIESGSHDYTISRREARDDLGLNVETPDESEYQIIKRIYDDIALDLQLTTPYDRNLVIGAANNLTYSFRRALLESVGGGSHSFVSDGTLSRQQVQVQPGVMQDAIADQRSFEGWKFENAPSPDTVSN